MSINSHRRFGRAWCRHIQGLRNYFESNLWKVRTSFRQPRFLIKCFLLLPLNIFFKWRYTYIMKTTVKRNCTICWPSYHEHEKQQLNKQLQYCARCLWQYGHYWDGKLTLPVIMQRIDGHWLSLRVWTGEWGRSSVHPSVTGRKICNIAKTVK